MTRPASRTCWAGARGGSDVAAPAGRPAGWHGWATGPAQTQEKRWPPNDGAAWRRWQGERRARPVAVAPAVFDGLTGCVGRRAVSGRGDHGLFSRSSGRETVLSLPPPQHQDHPYVSPFFFFFFLVSTPSRRAAAPAEPRRQPRPVGYVTRRLGGRSQRGEVQPPTADPRPANGRAVLWGGTGPTVRGRRRAGSWAAPPRSRHPARGGVPPQCRYAMPVPCASWLAAADSAPAGGGSVALPRLSFQ